MKQKNLLSSKVLVVDDEETSSMILSSILQGIGYEVDVGKNKEEMVSRLGKSTYEFLFLDYKLGPDNGLDLLKDIIREIPKIKVIMITAHGSIELALDAMHMGASGFISKPFDDLKVEAEILRANRNFNKDVFKKCVKDDIQSGIVGQSNAISRIHSQISKMKDVDSTVLVNGESGTGKELIARALHNLSFRSKEPYEALNCAAIPENLIEAELFGYKKGAFTDAKNDRKGLFEVCSNGTLFLDEIGELPLVLQSKLLRVLQEKVITPLGSSASKKVNTRVVVATNRNLRSEVEKGNFRSDLYYRVSILQIESPPLRDRVEDISLLVRYFIDEISDRYNKNIRYPNPELMSRLESYSWPGNVRELRNSLERAIVLSDSENLRLDDIFSQEQKEEESVEDSEIMDLSAAKDKFEKDYLVNLLKKTGGNVSRASKVAGRVRTDMYRLFSKHDIDPSEFS